jgi:2-dehydro-3-deoxyphosphogluconate aldolase / (4S)-4-hydroxy-2-oxoglutarate aldolase
MTVAVDGFAGRLREARLLGILRGCPPRALATVAEAARKSGLRFLEIALNTQGAVEQIAALRGLLNEDCVLGAGTVLSVEQARAAVDAGARFLVSPCLVPQVQRWANEHRIPTLPGAFTPTEIWNAYQAGAAVVKVFPARSAGGPAYFKELRGPFRDIPLLACGGVSSQNAREYLEAGADALAFGGSVFGPARLEDGDQDSIARDISALAAASGL